MGSKIGLKINIFFGSFGVLGGVIGFIVLHAFENYLAGKSSNFLLPKSVLPVFDR